MNTTTAVGIDLGTTYSSIAVLNRQGQPATIANEENELSTPSVVLIDDGPPIVGNEALRNAIQSPDKVVQHVKRFMGESLKYWQLSGVRYSPIDISSMILRKLIAGAQTSNRTITEAVVTVPAQFSDAQRHATVLAGHAAGLEHVEIIHEPVAAALCYVLGPDGVAFTALAPDQRLLVFDLGGGTLDLAIVSYKQNHVNVIASDGDLELGGLDWTQVIVDIAAERFQREFRLDPREDPKSHQALSLEAEQAKRSLSIRPRAAVTVQCGGHIQTYQVTQEEFAERSRPLVQRACNVTKRLLAENKMGWAHVDVLLTTGGASRMPMIQEALRKLSGRTLNQSLSPDQSIAHGAACYAGMLLARRKHQKTDLDDSASKRLASVTQQSVCARALGILVRDPKTNERLPHYLIPPNSPLPISRTQKFGTFSGGQARAHIRIVESGAGSDRPPTELGDCVITELPDGLAAGSPVEVTISYDRQARVQVTAREPTSGKVAHAEIIRQENVTAQLQRMAEKKPAKRGPDVPQRPPVPMTPAAQPATPPAKDTIGVHKAATPEGTRAESMPAAVPVSESTAEPGLILDESEFPVLLCNECGSTVDPWGNCPSCGASTGALPQVGRSRSDSKKPRSGKAGRDSDSRRSGSKRDSGPAAKSRRSSGQHAPRESGRPAPQKPAPQKPAPQKSAADPAALAEDEFWDLVSDD